MSINFLKDASYIRNYALCKYDTRSGYTTNFSQNGNVDGWDVYNNIFMYGSWNGVLFGSSYTNECYIGKSSVFPSLPADEYYHIEFILKVVDENTNKTVPSLTKGKIGWKRVGDPSWSTDRELEFNISEIGTWKYYSLNMGPETWWQGDINDIRFYPFTDGKTNDKFFIKYIRIVSNTEWICINPPCSYYQYYSHPCPGVGQAGSCQATTAKNTYSTVSGINDALTINIDDYGEEVFDIGSNFNIAGKDLSKLVGNYLSTLNIGGYSFVNVYHTEEGYFKVSSGTYGSDSSVVIPYSKAAVELGFYDDDGTSTHVCIAGTESATGFEYASTKQLATYELNRIVDSSQSIAYTHNPTQYSVEGGRRDFNEIGASELISKFEDDFEYRSFTNLEKTIVDLSHRIDNNGRIKHFWVYGKLHSGGKLKILRPHNDGSFTVVESIPIYTEIANVVYTVNPIVYRVDCNILVKKGDVVGVYNVDMYVGKTLTNLPDATFSQYDGDITGKVEKTRVYSYGIGGFSMYARGDFAQNNTILEIDMGYRLNVSEFRVFGQEKSSYFEFNVASCLDLSWNVNLFSGTHTHSGYNLATSVAWSVVHNDIPYGAECLDDGILTADNGKEGDSYGSDNGLATYGNHAYFYVNGDAEWLYANSCSDPSEFCGNLYPYGTTGFTDDPVEFTLIFPNDIEYKIHKSVMYFKEENNFRNFELSYYIDPYYTFGDATDNSSYKRISSYDKIILNGDEFSEGDDSNIDLYLFNNPSAADFNDYTDQESAAKFIAAKFVDWSILGHEFLPVNCRGFRLYCTKHYSTKLTELELYSRVSNDSSLVDNVLLQYSDYGDVWRSTGFETVDGGVTAFIGGTPRYFLLYFDSQTEFFINEVDVTVTDQTYVESDAVVLLDDARSGTIGSSKSVELINTYDKSFDLTVDIPRSLNLSESIVYHNKLKNESDIINSVVGPGSILSKSEDFPITTYHGQCATNASCYGLRNLIDGKNTYHNNNGEDWNTYGVAASGIDIGFYNTDYAGTYKHTIPINPISTKYIRICCLTTGGPFIVKDVLVYDGTTRLQIDKLYENEACDYSLLNNVFYSGDLLFSQSNTIGLKLYDSYAIDKIVLIVDSNTSLDTRIYVSTDNSFYFIYEDVSSVVETHYIQFAIDLENRHNIDFIRNYGTSSNLIPVTVFNNTSFSSSSGLIEDAIFNSTNGDCRWLNISIDCDSTTPQGISKLGIYPDISQIYCLGGGYNHSWDDLDTIFSEYYSPINVAYGSDISATTTYFSPYFPKFAVDGLKLKYSTYVSWGYERGSSPILYLDFGNVYYINKIVISGGYHPQATDAINNGYTFSIDPTSSGTYTQILSKSGISSNEPVEYEFAPVYARRAKLSVDSFSDIPIYTRDSNNNVIRNYVGFLREVEIYTYQDSGNVSSEDYPVVCMDLNDRFNTVDHTLINGTLVSNTDWDNDEQFFKYSDNISSDPSKVAFNVQGNYVTEYYSSDSSGNMAGSRDYIFTSSVFLGRGNHYVSWDAYYPENVNEISIHLDGDENIVLYATNYGVGWIPQNSPIFINKDGYFSIKVVQNIDLEYAWGARNPKVYRSYEATKWMSVKRDTATNYSWDDDSLKYGEDYLGSIQVYGDDTYNITEYDWWWSSTLSTLSRDSINVISGRSSLNIDYPTSSGTDTIQFIPGDTFGVDIDWALYDAINFNMFIDNIDKLDTTFGSVVFGGGLSGNNRFYYSWSISNMNLNSGWNSVALVFNDADESYSDFDDENTLYLDELLKLRFSEDELSNLYIVYRGVGDSFNIKLDTFKIKRNSFYTDLKFGKGLCLTGHDNLMLPISNINLDKGSIEFWMKLGTDSSGFDSFGDMYSNTIFTLSNNNNDLLALRIQPAEWFEVITGNIRTKIANVLEKSLQTLHIKRDELVHIALVWSNSGTDMDDESTLKLYINNNIEFVSDVTWDIGDTKLSFLKLGGGMSQTTGIQDSFTNFIIGNVKIYNYCKSTFSLEKESSEFEVIYSPENFVEISKDDINFYGIGSENLPLVFEQVPSGDKVTIYIRANKNNNFSNKNTTAQIVADWLITV